MGNFHVISDTTWIGELRNGNTQVADDLWQRYHQQLINLAHHRLTGMVGQMSDAEDVVVSAFKSFYRAVEEKRALNLQVEENIWRLLVTLTARKAIKLIRYENAEKRNQALTDTDQELIDSLIGTEPTPEFTMAVIDEFELLNEKMVDNDMRMIAYRKMEGFSNSEIAQELNCSVRTVKRRLAIIRTFLIEDLHEQEQ